GPGPTGESSSAPAPRPSAGCTTGCPTSGGCFATSTQPASSATSCSIPTFRWAGNPSAARRGRRGLSGEEPGQRVAQRLLPAWERAEAGRGPGIVAEHAVGGPRRRARELGGGDRPDPGRVRAEQAEDLPREPVPGHRPGTRRVIDAGRGSR